MRARIEVLFQKFLDRSCTLQEYHELMDLLKENQHEEKVRQMLQQVYESIARSLKSVTYVNQEGQLQLNAEADRVEEQPVARTYRLPKFVLSAAALLLISVGVWWLYRMANNNSNHLLNPTAQVVSKVTRPGQLKYLLLPDGTKVWLNAASTLEFPPSFNGDKREVKLTGEAYFDVTHVDGQPFLIHTGNVVTRVLGTAFNIKAYPGQQDVLVSVQRGKVQVSRNDQVMATLTKGQEIKVETTAQEEATVSETKEANIAAWTNGKLIYESRSVGDILSDLERTYDVTILLKDSSVLADTFTTSFRRDIGVEDALKIICDAINLTLSKENDSYILSKKK